MDTTRFLLEMAADLLTQLRVETVYVETPPDDFADTAPRFYAGRVDVEVGDEP
ncbi:MAG: hypothetical protein V4792_16455 [Pseudomonadota bacterium]